MQTKEWRGLGLYQTICQEHVLSGQNSKSSFEERSCLTRANCHYLRTDGTYERTDNEICIRHVYHMYPITKRVFPCVSRCWSISVTDYLSHSPSDILCPVTLGFLDTVQLAITNNGLFLSLILFYCVLLNFLIVLWWIINYKIKTIFRVLWKLKGIQISWKS